MNLSNIEITTQIVMPRVDTKVEIWSPALLVVLGSFLDLFLTRENIIFIINK